MSTLIVLDKLVQIAVLLLGGLFFRFNLFLLLLSFSSSFSIVNINLVEIWREEKSYRLYHKEGDIEKDIGKDNFIGSLEIYYFAKLSHDFI